MKRLNSCDGPTGEIRTLENEEVERGGPPLQRDTTKVVGLSHVGVDIFLRTRISVYRIVSALELIVLVLVFYSNVCLYLVHRLSLQVWPEDYNLVFFRYQY